MLSNVQIQNLLTDLEVTTTLFDTPFPTPTFLHLGLTLCCYNIPPIACHAACPATSAEQQTDIYCRAPSPHFTFECCVVYADNITSTSNPILLNPLVKVGYEGSAYKAVHSRETNLSAFQIYQALWTNRLRRWVAMTWWGEWDVQQRVMMWNKETLAREKGEFCVFDKMQVVVERGWKHV
jgi:hypothetical protein